MTTKTRDVRRATAATRRVNGGKHELMNRRWRRLVVIENSRCINVRVDNRRWLLRKRRLRHNDKKSTNAANGERRGDRRGERRDERRTPPLFQLASGRR